LSVYTSFLAGPRRPGEVDGPEELYVVLLDNGRTKLLPDRSKRQSLYCIRCGACGEVCPVKIDIPKVLLELRSEVRKSEAREGQNRLEKLAFRVFAWVVAH